MANSTITLYVPTSELLGSARANPRKRDKWYVEKDESALRPWSGAEGFLVRTALLRSEAYEKQRIRGSQSINSAEDVLRVCKHLVHEDQEHVVILAINAQNDLLAIHDVTMGSRGGAMLDVRDGLKVGLLTGAASIILVHNHPGGTPTPSEQDVKMTRALAKACECVGLALLDHCILSTGGVYSFVSNDMMA